MYFLNERENIFTLWKFEPFSNEQTCVGQLKKKRFRAFSDECKKKKKKRIKDSGSFVLDVLSFDLLGKQSYFDLV